jgi:hypothetical protein
MAFAYVGFGLETALVVILSRRGRKEFPLFFAYAVFRALASGIALTYCAWGASSRSYAVVYWSLNVVLHCLAAAAIGSLIYRAAQPTDRVKIVSCGAAMAACLVLAAVAPYDQRLGFWMTGAARNLSFYEEMLNFAVWMLLVRNRAVGSRFLWVSAGLGIQVTGEVLGHSLRLFASRSAIWAPNLLVNVCEMAALGMWLYGFARPEWGAFMRPRPYGRVEDSVIR